MGNFKKYKCVIFDLDGTLIDSLQGILDACNLTFSQLGIDIKKNYDEAKYLIGGEATEFAKRAIKDCNISKEKESAILDLFIKNYAKTQFISARPFQGINGFLHRLKDAGFYICIASNKPQELLTPIIKHLFPDIEFDVAMGQSKNAPAKPDPYIISEILKQLDISHKDCVYVGDSQYDVDTAVNAKLKCIIVKYGYGFYDEEWIQKADIVVNTVSDLESEFF